MNEYMCVLFTYICLETIFVRAGFCDHINRGWLSGAREIQDGKLFGLVHILYT